MDRDLYYGFDDAFICMVYYIHTICLFLFHLNTVDLVIVSLIIFAVEFFHVPESPVTDLPYSVCMLAKLLGSCLMR